MLECSVTIIRQLTVYCYCTICRGNTGTHGRTRTQNTTSIRKNMEYQCNCTALSRTPQFRL